MEKLAHDGVASAQNEIGTMYLEGEGYPRSEENALTWFEKAAGQGNEAARKSIETMSEAGDAGAQYALGAMHLSGTGYPQDTKRALDLFFKAAAHGNEDALAAITSLVNEGNPVAQYVLGEMYLEGKGYPQNTETALKWFFQSAARGYGESLQELRKLADGGNATAQHMLGTLHLEGRGVERDSFRALDFFFKAAVQGNKDASKAIERMAEAGDTGAKGYLQHLSQAELAGSLVAWGSNRYAKLDVPPGSDFVSVAAGGSYAVALKKDGSLVAWGDDYFGQTKVPQGSDFLEITAGMSHSLALKNDGSLVAWGSTRDGRLNVPQGRDFIAVAAGRYHSLGLKRDGSLAGWGSNTFGECNVPRGTDFIAIAAGASHSLALKKDGSLIAWGSNSNNQLNVPRGTDFIAIAAGDTHSLALKRDGSIVAWGRNENGQCDAPRGIDFVAIAAGTLHSLALRKDGTVVAWGASYYGQLDVPRNRKFTAISAGSDLSVGIYK